MHLEAPRLDGRVTGAIAGAAAVALERHGRIDLPVDAAHSSFHSLAWIV